MNIQRLTELCNLLETVPNKQFNIDRWYSAGDIKEDNSPSNSCGTVCCVIGWATQHKPFNDQGFKFKFNYFPQWVMNESEYDIYDGWRAVERFFDIINTQATYLFDGDSYKSGNPKPSTVIKRIKKLICEHTN